MRPCSSRLSSRAWRESSRIFRTWSFAIRTRAEDSVPRSRRATLSSWPGEVHLARRDARLQCGIEDHEVPAELVREAVDLRDLVLAVIAQQPDLHRALVEVSPRELVHAVLQDCSCDCSAVDL